MVIIFLVGLLFGGVTFVVFNNFEKIRERQSKITKWFVGIIFVILGIIVGGNVSDVVGKKITKKYLTSAPVAVLEAVDLLPFSGSSGAYIVTGKNQHGEKVAWYLQEEGLLEKPYNDIIDRDMIVFTNATTPVKQLVKVNVGFWKWFAIIPCEYRFVIPAGGLQKGKIVKNYKFIPVSE